MIANHEPRDKEIKSYVEESLVAEIDAAASEMGMSRSQCLRQLVRQGLDVRKRHLRAVAELEAQPLSA